MEKVKAILKSLANRLNNTGSILAFVALIINLLLQFGIKVDAEWVNNTVTAICALLVFLGVLNDPTDNKDAYIPGVNDKLLDTKKEEDKEE